MTEDAVMLLIFIFVWVYLIFMTTNEALSLNTRCHAEEVYFAFRPKELESKSNAHNDGEWIQISVFVMPVGCRKCYHGQQLASGSQFENPGTKGSRAVWVSDGRRVNTKTQTAAEATVKQMCSFICYCGNTAEKSTGNMALKEIYHSYAKPEY